MAAKRNIAALSIPFTAGVAVAAAIPSGEESRMLAALALSSVLPLLMNILCRGKGSPVPGMILFLVLGALCRTSFSLEGGTLLSMPPAAELLKEKFCMAVRGVGFEGEHTTSLLLSILCGERGSLPPRIRDVFRDSGASHILALSGLHLGIIYSILSGVLSVLGNSVAARTLRCITIISASGGYTVITGASPSLVRAFLFISISELSSLSRHRKKDNINIFCTALTIQLTLNPGNITNIGFQLSYLAMAGIYLVYPHLRDWYPSGKGRIHPMRSIWNCAALSISCQIFTAPLAYLRFGTFPVYFLLTNLISLPLTELLVISGLSCTVLEALHLCPHILKSLSDVLAQALVFCLETISSL